MPLDEISVAIYLIWQQKMVKSIILEILNAHKCHSKLLCMHLCLM